MTDLAARGSADEDNYFDTPEYQAFLTDCAKCCRCARGICGGVLAGGFCDELIEDDSDEEFYETDE